MRLVYLSIFFLLTSTILNAQPKNFMITLKVEGLDSGYFKFRFTEITSTSAESIIYSDSLSKEKNSVTITGFISEERYVYFSIRGVGEFDFGMGPGDTATIILKKGNN